MSNVNETDHGESGTAQSESSTPDPQAAMRDQVRDMTANVLRGRMLDPKPVDKVFRTVTTGTSAGLEKLQSGAAPLDPSTG
jgi:hypothetical protein